MKIKFIVQTLVLFVIVSCKTTVNNTLDNKTTITAVNKVDVANNTNATIDNSAISDTTFVNLKSYSKDFVYDMRYATNNNFLKTKGYECDECYLRLKTVKALIKANVEFLKKGLRIKLYDCYRPLDVQKKMWAIVSNPNYVANPAKGSIHNRGGAVDISLVNSDGVEVDMGTGFDYFGKEAAHSYINLTQEVLANRSLLKTIMLENNFVSINSEWWHYNLAGAEKDKISNFKWECSN